MRTKTNMPYRSLNLAAILLTLGLSGACLWMRIDTSPAYEDTLGANVLVRGTKETRYLYVRSHYTFKDLKKYLYKQNFLQDTGSFGRLARQMAYTHALIPGRYEIRRGMNNLELIELLASGRQEKVKLHMEGVRFKQELARQCGQYLEADETEILHLLSDKAFLFRYHVKPENVMSHFMGKIYAFRWNTSAKELLGTLLSGYSDFWTSDRLEKAKDLHLKPEEVVALASIVQEETLKKDEAPAVAGVYLNRLRKGMRLQADPTLKYVLLQRNPHRQVKRLYQYHFNIPSPYNTYLNAGLPPGPVVLPSEWAIDAVLNAEKHEYFYFVAREDFSGYHTFSTNYQEHLANSRRYQEELDRRNIH